MSISLLDIARQVDNPTSLGAAIDELLADQPVSLLGLGEPTHGVAAFPSLRNELLACLVTRGFRSVVLETDSFAASIVDEYVCGGNVLLDEVLATGFSHGFGALPSNRELVEWLRDHNSGRAPQDRVRFRGFDAPVEYSGAPSPRTALESLIGCLPSTLLPDSIRDLDALIGDEADWTNPAAMYDASASIGRSDRGRQLRIMVDELAEIQIHSELAVPEADQVVRTALGLLGYHEAMATPGPDRMDRLLSVRAEMMAENLLAIVAKEERGSTLVFAHNAHLLRGPVDGGWVSAGALVGQELGSSYMFIATDATPDSSPATLAGLLSDASARRALFSTHALLEVLPPTVEVGQPMLPGHLPLKPADLDGADAVLFLSEVDAQRHQYW